ncbi:hypothetical protein BDY21DRAFT_344911 [Lineolata rhizophorae]|uniref:Uncharacterized protein n=1 Tax=Lineolata rhizophorae TaxID=578093 RepID=A0A6A6P0V2_9PEZI|nr:hypothetical protein BDY21DRAFT_344911 [Lineolata rhizophorae]
MRRGVRMLLSLRGGARWRTWRRAEHARSRQGLLGQTRDRRWVLRRRRRRGHLRVRVGLQHGRRAGALLLDLLMRGRRRGLLVERRVARMRVDGMLSGGRRGYMAPLRLHRAKRGGTMVAAGRRRRRRVPRLIHDSFAHGKVMGHGLVQLHRPGVRRTRGRLPRLTSKIDDRPRRPGRGLRSRRLRRLLRIREATVRRIPTHGLHRRDARLRVALGRRRRRRLLHGRAIHPRSRPRLLRLRRLGVQQRRKV